MLVFVHCTVCLSELRTIFEWLKADSSMWIPWRFSAVSVSGKKYSFPVLDWSSWHLSGAVTDAETETETSRNGYVLNPP